MRNALPHFPFWVKDFQAATQDWTDEEAGAYLRLLMHQWNRGSIPDSPKRRARIADSLHETWETVGPKFPGGRNTRMEQVRRDAIAAHSSAVDRGKLGAATRWGDGSANSSANESANAQAVATKTKDKNKGKGKPKSTEKSKAGEPAAFTEFWEAYGHKVGKRAALRAWKSTAKDRPENGDLLAAVDRYHRSQKWKDGVRCNPSTWLNQGRWADEFSTEPAGMSEREKAMRRKMAMGEA